VHCKDTFDRAREVERLVDAQFEALGLLTSDKNEPPAQSWEFLGYFGTLYAVHSCSRRRKRKSWFRQQEVY
jgi:hypothetical protein